MEDPYSNTINTINSAGEKRLEIMASIITMFTSFSSNLTILIEKLQNLTIEIKEKSQSVNYSNFTLNCTSWIYQYLGTPIPLSQFIKSLNNEVIGPFTKFRNEYNDILNKIKSHSNESKNELNIITEQYQKTYQKYLDFCNNLEIEKNPSKIEQLKQFCANSEKECIELCEHLGFSRRSYCLLIEKLIIEFEELEKKFQKQFLEYTQSFCLILENLSINYQNVSKEATNSLDQFNQNKDLQKIESFLIRRHTHIADISLQVPEIDFNIFDYLNYDIIFKDDLKVNLKSLKENYSSKKDSSFIVEENEIVLILEKKKDICFVESQKSGLRGEIPESFLIDCNYKRYICKLIEDLPDINIKSGQYFVILDDSNEIYKCKTVSGTILHISKEKLKRV